MSPWSASVALTGAPTVRPAAAPAETVRVAGGVSVNSGGVFVVGLASPTGVVSAAEAVLLLPRLSS